MNQRTTRAIAVLMATLAYMAIPVLATDSGPQQAVIKGTLGGEEMSWQLQTDQRVPSAVFTSLTPGTHQIHINAYSSERYLREGSIELTLLIADGEVRSAEILFFPFPRLYPRFSFGSDHGTGTVSIDSLTFDANHARLSARFEGELYYHQSVNTRPISQRTRAASLQFDLTAVRE